METHHRPMPGTRRRPGSSRRLLPAAVLAAAAAFLAACGGGDDDAPAPTALACDDNLKTAFKPDADTTVLLVKAFAQGDPLLLSGTPTAQTRTAAADLCLVKLAVGPGNPGPADAPSTSAGIGIEVWLPAKANWNERIHNLGGGGWAGGSHLSLDSIGNSNAGVVAGTEGAVSSHTDTGHGSGGSGAFAMNPDGTVNQALWTDFAERALHQQAVQSKALAEAYYGRAARHAYWEGGSTGGRQGLKLAQAHPDDYDGLIVNYPAINWTKFITAELYPQIVYQRDLGGTPLSPDQQALMGNAAIAACDTVGGQHLGYVLDPSACHYDPTKDAGVLCAGAAGNGVTGTNATAACVSLAQATAMNKIWYGMTSDGSVPDPALDNGWAVQPAGAQRWYGLARGTQPGGLAGATPFTIASDMVALELQNPTLATPSFTNATGNGGDGWKLLSYAQLDNAFDRGVALQSRFGGINTDDPDLSAFAGRGGKMLTWHGLNDELIPAPGTVNYYNRVATEMGGLAAVQDFWKLYLVPAQGHGGPNGTTNPAAAPPVVAAGQMYALLRAWVEEGTAPADVVLQTPDGAATPKSRPICVYPQKATYTSGDLNVAGSYTCS
jgi:feruloyl esterase